MMDYYSEFPAPSYEECTKQVITDLRRIFLVDCRKILRIWNPNDDELKALVAEAFIDSNMFDDNNDPNPKIK